MDRIGRDCRVAGGQRRGAVALMHVAIDDHYAAPLLREPDRRDGKVVEHAIARAGMGERMMAAARAIGGKATLEREPRRQIGAPGDDLRPVGDRSVDWKTDPSLLLARHSCLDHFGDVIRVVRGFQPLARHQFRLEPRDRIAGVAEQVADRAVLVPLIAGFGLPWRDIVRVMDDSDHKF